MSDARVGEYEQRDQNAIRQWLVISCTAILCAALLIPFGALPLFETGYYRLVATSIQWLHFCAGIGAAVLFIGLIVNTESLWPRIFNPVSLAVGAFAIISAVAMVSATAPWLVLFGSPQSGKGVIWFLDAAAFIALAWTIRDFRPALFLIFLVALTVTAAVVGLLLYTRFNGTEFLLPGGKSYAYLGLLLPFLIPLLAPGPMRRYGGVAAWFASIGCVAISESKAAIGVFVVLTIAYGISRIFPVTTAWLMRARFSSVLTLIAVIALAAAYLVTSIDFRGTFDSLDSRILIAKIVFAGQIDASPLQWIAGHGWGHTQGELYRNLTESGASLLDNRWDFLWRNIFHSHNLVLELLYETGVLGLSAFFVLLASLIVFTPPEKRAIAVFFVAGYLLINSVWFEFAHTVPALSLAVFSIMEKPLRYARPVSKYRILALAGLGGTAICCTVVAASLYQFDSKVAPYKMHHFVLPRADFPTASFPIDPRGDEFIRASVYREVARKIDIGIQNVNEGMPASSALKRILDDIETRIATTQNPDLILVGLVIFNEGYFNKYREWIRPVVQGRELLWGRLARRHLELAPKRVDVLVVYLSWLVANKELQQARRLIAKVLDRNPNEPIATYFQGVIATQDSAQDAKRRGLQSIGRAVQLGVEKYLEVPGWLKKMATEAN